jgi:hypothetical protein
LAFVQGIFCFELSVEYASELWPRYVHSFIHLLIL